MTAALDPYIAEMLASGDAPPLDRATVRQAREEARQRQRPIDATVPDLDRVFDDVVADGGAPVPVRCYVPAGNAPMPMLLFIHGGGFVLGDLDTHDGLCRHLAAGAGAIVVALDYRRAPEHPYPAAVEDCVRIRSWLDKHGDSLGGATDRVAIVGDSAGGTLAIAVALRAAALPNRALALLYPVTDYPDDRHASYRDFASGHGLTRAMMDTFWHFYAPDRPDDAAPMRCAGLDRLPPTLVLTASHDVLRDEGAAFAAQVEAAGVETRLVRAEGVNHGFLHLLGAVPATERAMALTTAWLRDSLACA